MSARRRGRPLPCLLAAVCALAPGALGCSSVRSWSQGCAGVYSGVRFNREVAANVPLDGKIFFAFDLPGTVLADTLALPATAFADPEPPLEGFSVGCRWADP